MVAAGLRPLVRRPLERLVAEMLPARRLRFRLVLRELECLGRDDVSVLDAGCGDGILAEMIAAAHPGWRVLAVDRSEKALEWARQRLSRGARVEFLQRDLTEQLDVGPVDAVVAVESLVEIDDDAAAIRQLASVLRPGGLFVAHVPEASWEPVLSGSERTWRHEARHGYTALQLEEMLGSAGLELRSVVFTCRGMVRLGQEIRDRMKHRDLLLQAAMAPAMAVAPWLELRGVTWGRPRALLATAVRQVGAATREARYGA
jgi:SAM-dependent methyltransferase